jgi:hypothetical protein
MGLGILEVSGQEHVPGTARLEDIGAEERNVDVSTLSHNKDGIILVPQPSSSPNDPLVPLPSPQFLTPRTGRHGERKPSLCCSLPASW